MRLIDANALMKRPPDIHDTYDESGDYDYAHGYTINAIKTAPTVDAVPVVRCKDCINYVESEEANGEKMCVKDADWCVEDGCYYGFTEYPSPDWFCADGERKGGEE